MNFKQAARAKVYEAVKVGKLVRPKVCELCGTDVDQPDLLREALGLTVYHRIVAHHWRGYDYPLDIWWICARCNRRLIGLHDGSLTKAEAQFVIKHRFLYGSSEAKIRKNIIRYPPGRVDIDQAYAAHDREVKKLCHQFRLIGFQSRQYIPNYEQSEDDVRGAIRACRAAFGETE